jgi:hypothetical protein
MPPFAGLRRFPEGRGFKQWTGDDSKALMKAVIGCLQTLYHHLCFHYQVYLPALQGHLPGDVLRTFSSFLEFYYTARRDIITEDNLDNLEDAITRFHSFRDIFAPIRGGKGFSLPRQHAIAHYPPLIRLFAAPNGLCSSITESKHIRAVKEPWHWSNRNEALFQMLRTNQRLDQLSAARVNFAAQGMLDGTLLESVLVGVNGAYCTNNSIHDLSNSK